MFQAEGTARAEALRWEGTWHVQRLAGRPVRLEGSKPGGGWEEVRAEGPDQGSLVSCNEAFKV